MNKMATFAQILTDTYDKTTITDTIQLSLINEQKEKQEQTEK
jgi:hypothetical protein